jgi:hypothetical protein
MATASLATGMASNAGAVVQPEIRYPTIGLDGRTGPAWIDVTVSSETTGDNFGNASGNAVARRPEMRLTLTGTGRNGSSVRFARVTIPSPVGHARRVRLHISRRQRAAFTHSRRVVATAAAHWDSPSDPDTRANAVSIDTAVVFGSSARNEVSGHAVRGCSGIIIGRGRVNARGCDLRGADLAGADLGAADFRGAHLDGARLDGANLSRANLSGANLTGAILTGANFTGANWNNTTCPNGTVTNTGC